MYILVAGCVSAGRGGAWGRDRAPTPRKTGPHPSPEEPRGEENLRPGDLREGDQDGGQDCHWGKYIDR